MFKKVEHVYLLLLKMTKSDNIIIALDESTTSTGYAIFKNNQLVDYGAIIEKSKDVLERVNNIVNKICDIIRKYKPNDIVLENVQITMSAPTAKSLMGLQFIIEIISYRNNIKCTAIRTAHWRKVLGLSNSPKINRATKKKEAMEYVKNKYNISEEIDDVTDAICIGECFIKENYKEETDL